MMPRYNSLTSFNTLMFITIAFFSCATESKASIDLLTGAYFEAQVDLRVKVLGGEAVVRRSYDQGGWQLNRRWSSLKFKHNPGGGIISIERNGLEYKKKAGSVFINGARLQFTQTISGFRWADRKGNWIDYDSNGKILSYGDKRGLVFTLKRNVTGNIIGLLDPNGKEVISFEYTNGDMTRAIDYAGRSVSYHYNIAHFLTKVIDVRGSISTYTYDNANRISKHVDPLGRIVTITYDLKGKILSEKDQDGAGNRYEYIYSAIKDEHYISVTSSGGKISEYYFNSDRVLRKYSVNGHVKEELRAGVLRSWQETDSSGNISTSKYDEWDNLVERIHADGTKTSYTYDRKYSLPLSETNENGIATNYTYDSSGNVTKVIEAAGTSAEQINDYNYDAYGQLLSKTVGGATFSFEYDEFGNRVKQIDGQGKISTYTYDAIGNLLSATDALGNVINNTYDAAGNALLVTDALGHQVTNSYDESNNLLSEKDERGNTTLYAYDTRGNRVSDKNAQGAEVLMSYDADNNLIKQVDASGKATTLAYDAGGMMRSITDAAGDSIEIGSNGNASGQPSSIKFPTFTRNMFYDKRDRVIQTTDILDPYTSVTKKMGYDAVGNLTSETDNAGRTTLHQYDALNRKIQTIKPNGDTTQFAYDARGNLSSVTNGKGQVVFQYEYDLNDWKTKEIRPMGQVTSYAYDDGGRLISKTDPNGKITTMIYDAAGLTSSVTYPAVNGLAAKTVSYTYDNSGNMLTWSDGAYSGEYSYDSENRQLSQTINYGSFILSSRYNYLPNGKKASYTGVDGVTLSYSYDVSNKLQAISIPLQGSIIYNSYHGALPTKITLPGGSTRNYSYDGLQRVTAIQANDPAGNSLMNYGYTYDASSNIKQKNTEHGVYTYGYDAIDRLTSVQPPVASGLSNETFSYDKAGNRTTYNGSAAWTYNAKDELVTRPGVSYVYDLNGNMIQKTEGTVVTDYVYNSENRLAQVKQDAIIIASYTYDPFGKRMSKTANGLTTYYAYNNEGLSAELDSVGTVQVTYGYVPDSQWGVKPLFTQSGGNYYYYINDHIETPQKLIAKNGAVAWEAKYEAFGQTAVNTTSNIRFPGQYADTESGLNYNFNRMYNPKIGRYTSLDPLGLNGGMNPYMYAGNNPVSFTDPSGLLCFFGQSSGNVSCFDKKGKRYHSFCGYSGYKDKYSNNPKHEDKVGLGVIPKGVYSMSGPMTMYTDSGSKPKSRLLTPFMFTKQRLVGLGRGGYGSTGTYGEDGGRFWIHRPHKTEKNLETKNTWLNASSQGCVIGHQIDIDKIRNKGEYLVVY